MPRPRAESLRTASAYGSGDASARRRPASTDSDGHSADSPSVQNGEKGLLVSLLRAFGVALVSAAFGAALLRQRSPPRARRRPRERRAPPAAQPGSSWGPSRVPAGSTFTAAHARVKKACNVVKARQTLYKGETLSSKNGTISFYSTEDSAPDFTCQMSKNTQSTFYPPVKLDAPVVLQVEAGAISCEVHDGAEGPKKARAQQAILVYGNDRDQGHNAPRPDHQEHAPRRDRRTQQRPRHAHRCSASR